MTDLFYYFELSSQTHLIWNWIPRHYFVTVIIFYLYSATSEVCNSQTLLRLSNTDETFWSYFSAWFWKPAFRVAHLINLNQKECCRLTWILYSVCSPLISRACKADGITTGELKCCFPPSYTATMLIQPSAACVGYRDVKALMTSGIWRNPWRMTKATIINNHRIHQRRRQRESISGVCLF